MNKYLSRPKRFEVATLLCLTETQVRSLSIVLNDIISISGQNMVSKPSNEMEKVEKNERRWQIWNIFEQFKFKWRPSEGRRNKWYFFRVRRSQNWKYKLNYVPEIHFLTQWNQTWGPRIAGGSLDNSNCIFLILFRFTSFNVLYVFNYTIPICRINSSKLIFLFVKNQLFQACLTSSKFDFQENYYSLNSSRS